MRKTVFTRGVLFLTYSKARKQPYPTLKCLRSPVIFYLFVVIHHTTHVRVVDQCSHSLLNEYNQNQISHPGVVHYDDTSAHPIDDRLYNKCHIGSFLGTLI